VKAAWVRPGGPKYPDPEKAKKYGITRHYWDATDPAVDSKFLDAMRTRTEVGITRDPSWGNLTGKQLAQTLSDDLVRLASPSFGAGLKQCAVIVDIEAMWQRGSGYVLEWLTAWRNLRPTRPTCWTTEPFQGGTVSDELAARINADPNLIVVPQLYFGAMVPAVESQVAMEMVSTSGRRDIDRSRVKCYYDAAHLPLAWDGIVFDFNALP
jgi:hypothetical protein